MAEKVEMMHKDLDARIWVARSAVPFHMASGWEPTDGAVTNEEQVNVPVDAVPAETETVRTASKRVKES